MGIETAMIVGAAVSVAATAASTYVAVQNANAQADAAAAAAQIEYDGAREQIDQLDERQLQLDSQIESQKLKTLQEENLRRRKLRETLSTQVATATALGFDTSQSRDFMAIQDSAQTDAKTDLRNIKLMGDMAVQQIGFQKQATYSARRQAVLTGRAAQIMPVNNANASLFRGVAQTTQAATSGYIGYKQASAPAG